MNQYEFSELFKDIYSSCIIKQISTSLKLSADASRIRETQLRSVLNFWDNLYEATENNQMGRGLLELHSRNELCGDCEGCDYSGYEAEPPPWPCRTIALLAKELGVTWQSLIGTASDTQ